MNRALAFIALFFAVGAGSFVYADTLNLKNGDQISGNLVEVSEGVLVFRSTLAGKMMLPVSQVLSVSTTSDFVMEFKDGTRRTGRLSAEKDGTLKFVDSRSAESKSIKVADIANAARVPAAPSGGRGWSGFLEAGPMYQLGNEDYVALYARLRMRYESDIYSYRGDTGFDVAAEGENPRLLRSRHSVAFSSENEARPLVELELERDLDEALSLRARLGAGVGITLYEGDRDTLTGQFGLSAMREQYDADEWRALDVLPGSGFGRLRGKLYGAALDDEVRDDIGLDLAFTHSRNVFRDSSLEEELRLRPSLTELDEFTSSYESRLSVPLTERMHLKLNVRVDYDNKPQYRYLDEWRAAVGAGISWDF